MRHLQILIAGGTSLAAALGPVASAAAATDTVQVGPSGATFASSAVQCGAKAGAGGATLEPMVQAGLFNAKRSTSATVSLDGEFVATVTAAAPAADVWLARDRSSTVVVALGKKTADSYVFNVGVDECPLNNVGPDDTLEYAKSGKSYATITPGCALSPKTGQPQKYVHLFDNGSFLLNISVNGVPLTQLSPTRPHTPVFLNAGFNVISAANGSLSTDYYVRDGGDGTCVLNP